MPDYVYRGGSLSEFRNQEFQDGEIKGMTAKIVKGQLEEIPDHINRGSDMGELPWFAPEGHEGRPFMVEERGITGGMTTNISTAVNFGGGVPMVLYLNTRRVDGSPLQYSRRDFDTKPGALAWVHLDRGVVGEIRDMDEGLVGLVHKDGPDLEVFAFGDSELKDLSRQHQQEREWVAFSDSIDVRRGVDTVATFFTGDGQPRRVLDKNFDYTIAPGSKSDSGSSTDISDWEPRRSARELWEVVAGEVELPTTDYWIVILNTTMLGTFPEIDKEWFNFAYNGQRIVDDPAEVPDHIFGKD